MSWLLWILFGLGAGLIILGLYYVKAMGRSERSPFPLGDALRDPLRTDPLDDPFADTSAAAQAGHSPQREPRLEPQSESRIAAPSGFDELGVGPVRLRPQDEAEAARLATARAPRPRFSYKTANRDSPPPSGSRREPHLDAGVEAKDTAPNRSTAPSVPNPTPPMPQQTPPQPVPATAPSPAQPSAAPDVIPLYLVARQPDGFAGSTLLPLFAQHGFEFGEMDVYHYTDANGQTLFSLMNGVAPGTFDPNTLPAQSTPALALFLRLPIARQPNLVLEQFLDLAYHMADALNARILDELREELSTESVDRMRALVTED